MACSAHDRALPVLELGMLLTHIPCCVACKSAREQIMPVREDTQAAYSLGFDLSDPDAATQHIQDCQQ